MSSTMESISKHSLTKWYLYILRRKALIIPFWVCVKKPPQAHRAYRILDIISAWNTIYDYLQDYGDDGARRFHIGWRCLWWRRSHPSLPGLPRNVTQLIASTWGLCRICPVHRVGQKQGHSVIWWGAVRIVYYTEDFVNFGCPVSEIWTEKHTNLFTILHSL